MRRTWTLTVEVTANGKTDAIVAAVVRAVGREESVEPVKPKGRQRRHDQHKTLLEWDWPNSVTAQAAVARLRRLRDRRRWQSVMTMPALTSWWRDES